MNIAGEEIDDAGHFRGTLQPTGLRPYFLDKLRDRGIELGNDFFRPQIGMAQ